MNEADRLTIKMLENLISDIEAKKITAIERGGYQISEAQMKTYPNKKPE